MGGHGAPPGRRRRVRRGGAAPGAGRSRSRWIRSKKKPRTGSSATSACSSPRTRPRGKTVVAEYAFALASKHCTRAIYTSPIKTISNQKFRDFTKDGFDVGLLTGDVSIRPEAPCLIMTTEILRSMLYRGADLIRDVEWVIFDEVHYVNDAERGVGLGGKSIIMLPEHVGLVLLSATVPNVWGVRGLGRTHETEEGVRHRHDASAGAAGAYALLRRRDSEEDFYKVGEREAFLPAGYKKAADALNKSKKKPPGGAGAAPQGGPGAVAAAGRGGVVAAGSVAARANAGNKHPGRGGGTRGSVFGGAQGARGRGQVRVDGADQELGNDAISSRWSSSRSGKRRCDTMVDSLTGLDLTGGAEREEEHEIHVFCERCLSRLSPPDRKLPQVLRVRELLRRGLGVHHAGLLPIVKEIVEMLFCRGLLKVLFSTETFRDGRERPGAGRCVSKIYGNTTGANSEGYSRGEYTQMAGPSGSTRV